MLLCDEPTGALDFQTGKLVLEALAQANRELGMATAVITHNADILGMANPVITMRSGKITNVQYNNYRLTNCATKHPIGGGWNSIARNWQSFKLRNCD